MTPLRSATAYAKVNLALHVRRRRDDGYHELETVFAFCEDGDTVTARGADTTTLTIDGPFAAGLSPTDNLVVRAASALGVTARLHLTKNLPVASGIGGGSADAAAVLRLLGHDRADLAGTALELGADVPACVASMTVRGSGVGEIFTPEAAVTGTPLLLVNPRVPLSTGAVFAAWDRVDRGPLGDWRTGRNDLQAPAIGLVPVIGALVAWLGARPGATIARMSGSGATCFALFEGEAARDDAAAAAARDWPDCWTLSSRLR